MTDDGWHSIIWECQTMNIGDIQRHPELMGGDSCPRVPFPELLLFLQYLSMQLLLAGDIFCIEECGTANLISCGTMEGWSLPNFRRTNWWSEGMETTLDFYQECQPPQLDLICIPHLWGLDHITDSCQVYIAVKSLLRRHPDHHARLWVCDTV